MKSQDAGAQRLLREGSLVRSVSIALIATLIGIVLYNARTGVVSSRIANESASATARPVEYWFGLSNWILINQIWTTLAVMAFCIACAVIWVRNPRHPYVLMMLATTGLAWLDPLMNWLPYAVYEPNLWHFPEDWPWANLSPDIQPFLALGYASLYFGPFFIAKTILLRLQAGRSDNEFANRHPLISIALLTFAIGFVLDALVENLLLRTGLLVYTQVPSWGSVFTGTPFQFPLLTQSSLVTIVMMASAVLCHGDEAGGTQAEKLARKIGFFHTRPALATFLVMFTLMNVAYCLYGLGTFAIRAGRLATSAACPWPYPSIKIYDPDGLYRSLGAKGPFFETPLDTWMNRMHSATGHEPSPKSGGEC